VDLVREREPRELEVEPRVEVAGRRLQCLDLPEERFRLPDGLDPVGIVGRAHAADVLA
jgi:hypothetical protein